MKVEFTKDEFQLSKEVHGALSSQDIVQKLLRAEYYDGDNWKHRDLGDRHFKLYCDMNKIIKK